MAANTDIEKRAHIKEAAKKLFFQLGFSKTSMDDIARESGLAKPTLYYYYPSKESIFNEIVLEEAKEFMNQLEARIDSSLPADERLKIFIRDFYNGLKQYTREMESLPEYFCDHSPHGRPIIQKIQEILLEKIEPLLRAGVSEGIFSLSDPKSVAQSLVFQISFLNHDWMQHYPEKTRNKIVNTTIEIILNGLKRR
ncbi:MAG: TetR/AcrR family transcriptional regulator [Calditrichaeota bacterium]|nr:MAG: TetR/AcrR family transcriptional regulator [Calditrichota bacterium]